MRFSKLLFTLLLSSCIPVHRQVEWNTTQITEHTEKGMEIIGSKNWRKYKFYESHTQEHTQGDDEKDHYLTKQLPQEDVQDPDDEDLDITEAVMMARAVLFYPWENTIVDLTR